MQRDQRRLAGGRVLAGRLAHRCGIGGEIEQIVGKLEGKPDRRPEFRRAARGRPRGAPPAIAPASQAKRINAPVFMACSVMMPALVGTASLGREVERLAAGHAADAGGARQAGDQLEAAPARSSAARARRR